LLNPKSHPTKVMLGYEVQLEGARGLKSCSNRAYFSSLTTHPVSKCDATCRPIPKIIKNPLSPRWSLLHELRTGPDAARQRR
jgi:hypothetical protein